MIEQWLEVLSQEIVTNLWIAPFMALLAGILTSVTPCALSGVPLIIGYVGRTGENNTKKAFWLSLTFAGGMAVTFTVLGTAASLAGKLMGTSSKWWYLILGVLMVLMALQTWEVYQFIPSVQLNAKNSKKGYLGVLIAGILGGIFSSPCATPVLIVLLGLVARGGNVLWGILLLLFYSIGHSFLVIIAGTSIGFVKKITESQRYSTFNRVLRVVLGTVIMAIALYMFYLGF